MSWGDRVAGIAATLEAGDTTLGSRELPSRTALRTVVERLHVSLFAAELGPGGLDVHGRRAFVHLSLDEALRALCEQVGREPGLKGTADAVILQFADALPDIRDVLRTDLSAAVAGDPAATSQKQESCQHDS